MNYEEKYNEALKVIESLYNIVKYQLSSDAILTCQTIVKAFPELRESEDERIRKGLIKGLSAMRDIHKHQTFSDDAINIDDAIAWLEKQGKTSWKPSEEQMEAIKYFIGFHRPQANASTEGWNEFKHLESLYNELENLDLIWRQLTNFMYTHFMNMRK